MSDADKSRVPRRNRRGWDDRGRTWEGSSRWPLYGFRSRHFLPPYGAPTCLPRLDVILPRYGDCNRQVLNYGATGSNAIFGIRVLACGNRVVPAGPWDRKRRPFIFNNFNVALGRRLLTHLRLFTTFRSARFAEDRFPATGKCRVGQIHRFVVNLCFQLVESRRRRLVCQ